MTSVMTVAPAPAPALRAKRPVWAWARILGGVGLLALLVWQVGSGPFLDGLRAVNGPVIALAFVIGVVTTVCCAWRWSLVSAGLGVALPLREAVTAYYRAQFLNTTLPGGVIGDVHRAVRHGLDIGDVGLGVRAVVLERVAGQTVMTVMAVLVLFAFPSPVQAYVPVVAGAVVAAVLVVVFAGRALALAGPARWERALRRVGSDIRDGLFAHRNWMGVVVASAVVVIGQLMTFLLAARTAGSTASFAVLLPLTSLAFLAMLLPLNVAGWGPREGMAAWVFGAAGLTATQGVTTAVTYGVLAFVGSLPGAFVLLARWLHPETDYSDEAPAGVRLVGQSGARG